MAQDEAAPAEEEAGMPDEIVVTASGRDQTKIESSISVTSVSAQMIQDFQPSSEAEVFKLLPGIQVPGTSGPGGNSNIARGESAIYDMVKEPRFMRRIGPPGPSR